MRIKKSIANLAYLLAGIWTTWTITTAHTTALGITIAPLVVILALCSLDGQGWQELKGGWFDD